MTTLRDIMADAPWRLDFYALMRALENSNPDKPRIGRSEVKGQDIVSLRQEPFVTFPDSTIARVDSPRGRPLEVFQQFLGYFGPQGALPLETTLEALEWHERYGDPAFARFTDILSDRFLQLFYRAWADARPLVQHGRSDSDRFRDWLGSFIGTGTPALRERDAVPDIAKLRFAGILGSRVKSATRLRQILRDMLGLDVEVEERVGSWLQFEPGDRTELGGPRSGLGQTACLGSSVYSINEKICLYIHSETLAEYEQFLPGGRMCRILSDFVYYYLGDTVDVDIALTLPKGARPSAKLGQSGQLGWTTFCIPDGDDPDQDADARIVCATFSATEIARQLCAAGGDGPSSSKAGSASEKPIEAAAPETLSESDEAPVLPDDPDAVDEGPEKAGAAVPTKQIELADDKTRKTQADGEIEADEKTPKAAPKPDKVKTVRSGRKTASRKSIQGDKKK